MLLGIPSLTQRWRGQILDPPYLPNGAGNYLEFPDPKINIILAAVSVFCEFAGNLCLVLRFSNYHSKAMTWLSYGLWIAKIGIGIGNYVSFGVANPQTEDIVYLQGFWVNLPLKYLSRYL